MLPIEGGNWEVSVTFEILRSVTRSFVKDEQETPNHLKLQQSVCGSHEDRNVGLLNSFLIWRRIFLSSGWHFEREDIAWDSNMNIRNKLLKVFIVLGFCWLIWDWDMRNWMEISLVYIELRFSDI
jgi:hypothetical protein